MLQEVNDALEGAYRDQGLQHIQPTDSVKACKRQSSPPSQDVRPCKRTCSKTNTARLAAPDFLTLAARHECLRPYVTEYEGKGAIDFRDWNAVHALAQAHLHEDFDVCGWSVPAGHLVPAIPNRLSYILWIQDLLQLSNRGTIHPSEDTRIPFSGFTFYLPSRALKLIRNRPFVSATSPEIKQSRTAVSCQLVLLQI